jgi:hypothetical protein
MEVKRIVVDELPECCSSCQFHIVLDYVGKDWCTAAKKTILEKITYKLISPSWCPLQVEDECVWVREKTDRGYAAFYIPKDHEQHIDCYTQDAGTYDYCPTCGKRIKYVEE